MRIWSEAPTKDGSVYTTLYAYALSMRSFSMQKKVSLSLGRARVEFAAWLGCMRALERFENSQCHLGNVDTDPQLAT